MRPDEHKKKKNAVYKKKHGISNKSSDNTKDKQNDERSKTPGATAGENQKSSTRPKTTSQALSGSSSENDDEVVERKSFKRREIVSNWNKYDVEPDIDEHVKSRGEDFKKLLNMGGEAISHFRFQEELEWDEDAKSGKGDAAQRGAGENSFLALDLTDIASSISCVPIHQVLGIDQSLFPADQLEAHMKAVNENCSLYLNYLKSKEDEKRARESESNVISNDVCTSQGGGPRVKADSDRSPHQHQDNRVVSPGGGLEKHHKKNTIDKKSVKPSETAVVNRENTPPKVNTTSGKDSKISSPKSSNVKKSIPEASSTSLHLQDEGLDQLLDITDDSRADKKSESTVNKSEKVNAASSSLPKKDDKKEAEELEDWLDSILD